MCIIIQPLWLKATAIVESEAVSQFVIHLGGFHLLMSALGAACALMMGSGLEESLQLLYEENVVGHIMSGKAYARSLRANLLVESAIMSLLASALMPLASDDAGNHDSSDGDRIDVGQCRCN